MHHGQGLSGPNFVPFCGLGTGFLPQLVSAAGIAWYQLPLLLLRLGVNRRMRTGPGLHLPGLDAHFLVPPIGAGWPQSGQLQQIFKN